ncbi:MAG: chorismate-binding protein, partial [Bacteroidota bacterium]
ALCLEKNLPFAVYRLPGSAQPLFILQTGAALQTLDSLENLPDQQGFLVAPFHRTEQRPVVLLQPDVIVEDEEEAAEALKIAEALPALTVGNTSRFVAISEADYKAQVEKIVSVIRDSNLRKAVLSRIRVEKLPASFAHAVTYQDLCARYPEAFVYLFNLPGQGTWMGASPELLVRLNTDWVETMALAGTQPSPTDGRPLTWDEKEIDEQAMVSDYIASCFRDFEVNNVIKSGPHTVEAGNLSHLRTTFRVSRSEMDRHLGTFIDLLHPTPAICGVPQLPTLHFLLELEPHDREYYCGYLGPWGLNNSSDLFVNLRCMKISTSQAGLFVGGGITAGSDPEKEWRETVLKSETLLTVM